MAWIKSLVEAGYGWAGTPGYSRGIANGDRAYVVQTHGRSKTGTIASSESALKVSAWYAAHRILSEQFAVSQIKLYKRTKSGGKELADEEVLGRLLKGRPNILQDWFIFKAHCFSSKFFNGNTFIYKQKSEAGLLAGLMPLDPGRVRIVQRTATGELYYLYTDQENNEQLYSSDDILHWRGPTLNGILGVSMVHYAADCIGIDLKRQAYKEHILENRATPSGHYTVPGKLSEGEFKNLVAKIRAQNSGPENAGKVIVLDNGGAFKNMSFTNEELEFIDGEKMSIDDTGRFTGVPSILLNQNDNSTFNNSAEATKSFLRWGLNPHLVSFESLLNLGLIDKRQQGKLFFEFDRSDFEKMDLDKTAEWVKTMRYAGCISANEGRAAMNLVPKNEEYADELLRPENMAPASAEYQPNTGSNQPQQDSQNQPKNDQKQDKKADKSTKNSTKEALSYVFADVLNRTLSKTRLKSENLKKKVSDTEYSAQMEAFFKEQREVFADWFKPGIASLFKLLVPDSTSAKLAQERLCFACADKCIDILSAEVNLPVASELTIGEFVSWIFEKVEEYHEAN